MIGAIVPGFTWVGFFAYWAFVGLVLGYCWLLKWYARRRDERKWFPPDK